MPLSSHSERLMGTTITISLVDERADSLLQKSFDLLRELEYRFNSNSQDIPSQIDQGRCHSLFSQKLGNLIRTITLG